MNKIVFNNDLIVFAIIYQYTIKTIIFMSFKQSDGIKIVFLIVIL